MNLFTSCLRMPRPANKKIIAIDIDEVIAIHVPAFIEFSNKRWGTSLRVEDYDDHWAKMWEIDHEEVAKRTEEMDREKLASSLEPIKDAKPVLEKLTADYKLVVTTARRTSMTAETLEWIDKYFPGIFQEVHFAGMWDRLDSNKAIDISSKATKAELLLEISADYLVDDHPKHCFAAARAGIKTVLFGDYPWSRNLKLPKGVVRAKNWQEVLEYFDESR